MNEPEAGIDGRGEVKSISSTKNNRASRRRKKHARRQILAIFLSCNQENQTARIPGPLPTDIPDIDYQTTAFRLRL